MSSALENAAYFPLGFSKAVKGVFDRDLKKI